MAGKRHHYLPKWILRRFAVKEGQSAGLIWRADLSGEQIRLVAPKYEAARQNYYSLPPELQLPPGYAEEVLDRIESAAASATLRLESGKGLGLDDRHWLALFLLLQHRRTPVGRAELRYMDEFVARQQAELTLSNREAIRRALTSDGTPPSDEDVTEWQEQRLAELEAGDLIIESTPEREVALMFSQLDTIAPKLVENFDWMFLQIPETGPEIVLPDVGVTLFDPTPPFPEAGTGFASSPTSETVLYLGARLVLMLRPGEGSGDMQVASAENVVQLNRRALACSDKCIYGPSEDSVKATLERAAAEPERIDALRPRPKTFWIAEMTGEPTAGPIEFVGHSQAGTVTRELYVRQEGIDEARRNAIRVSDDDDEGAG